MQPAADPAAARPTSVLDASALLALAHGEDGERVVADAIDDGAAIGIVNLAEVLSKLADDGRSPGEALTELRKTDDSGKTLLVEPLTEADCVDVARLRPRTRAQGLSLADRACLALAARLGVPALTADRTWATAEVDAEVTLIR